MNFHTVNVIVTWS